MKTGAFSGAENSGVSQNGAYIFQKMKGKYDIIMMIAVDFGHTPFLDIPIVFC